MAVSDLAADELQALLDAHGSVAAVARHLKVAESTLRDHCQRLGVRSAQASKPRRRSTPLLTREALHQAMLPPNNCAVKRFLDQIDEPEQREIVEEALGYDRQDLSASALRNVLINAGYDEREVPGTDAINNHRSGTRPCRCKG